MGDPPEELRREEWPLGVLDNGAAVRKVGESSGEVRDIFEGTRECPAPRGELEGDDSELTTIGFRAPPEELAAAAAAMEAA
jgi:hypothetical protein